MAISGSCPKVHPVGVTCLGSRLPERTRKVVNSRVCGGCVGIVMRDEIVGEGPGRSSRESPGDHGASEIGIRQRRSMHG